MPEASRTSRTAAGSANGAAPPPIRLLITAGPTQEPIDAVRYIGNRSSGRLGVALADAAAARRWQVTLLLGPTPLAPSDSRVRVARFRTTAELQALLNERMPETNVLVMAAAVADYRPAADAAGTAGKIRRIDQRMTLELEPTPDLLAACAAGKRPGQFIVGFALEPRERMEESARAKLDRKGLDLIVANPLETMNSATIEAMLISRDGTDTRIGDGKPIAKERFAGILLDQIESRMHDRARASGSRVGTP